MAVRPEDTSESHVNKDSATQSSQMNNNDNRRSQHHFARAYSQNEDALTHNYYARVPSLWLRIERWFLVNTFAPQWLAKKWHHPVIGYLVALLVQLATAVVTTILMRVFPTFVFSDLLAIFIVALVAVNFGTGPSLLATLVGILVLNFFVLPPPYTWSFTNAQDYVEMLLFLIVGVTISVGASQVERARRGAIAERTLLDAVIETMPDSVSIFDAYGRLIRLNKAGRRMEEEQGIELPTYTSSTKRLRTIKGEPYPQQELPVTRALRGGVIANAEMVWHAKTGDEQHLAVSAAPLYDAWNRIAGAVAISHDVSALRKSEQKASESASEFEAIFESMADGVFVFDQDGLVIRINAAFREMLGISTKPDYFSQALADRKAFFHLYNEQGQPLPPEQWPQSRILRGEVLTGSNTMDTLIHTIDQRTILLNVSGAPVYAQDKRLIGGVTICRDITERRQLERHTHDTLYALLEMAQTLVQGSDDTEMQTQEEHAASMVGQRLAELTRSVLQCKRVAIIAVEPGTNRLLPVAAVGLTPVQEHHWWEYIPTRYFDEQQVTGLARLREGETILLDTTQFPFNAAYTIYNLQKVLLAPMTIGHAFIGMLVADCDGELSMYTEDEKILANAVAKLAALVIERERLLREQAEAHANELALREANHRMNEFLGIASHELKTPITTIKGSIQLLERRLKKIMASRVNATEDAIYTQEEAQDLLRRTSIQVNRLTRLINDLLDVSRIQANRLEPHMEPCDLAEIVRVVVEEQSRIAPSRVIMLHADPPHTVPIFADIDRIEQVLTNYISNALKYSAEDKPVEVILRTEGHKACVFVHDEGPGLPLEEQQHLWDRFYRAKGIEVQSGSGVGLGLGLYICKTIIELHQGQVGVDSEEGKGSTFWFSLPLEERA